MTAFEELSGRGLIDHCSNEDDLKTTLAEGAITFYAGFDPTAPSLHIGNLALVMTVAHLERAGHTPLVLVGGGTAKIGDPGGKTADREMLPEDTIRANAAAIGTQVSRYLSNSAEVINNDDWLANRNYIEFLREIGSHFRVNEMVKAEGYRQRLEREQGLSFLEFSYQLIQGYDFLHLYRDRTCLLQVGGSDQWGNIAAGISLTRRIEGAEVYGLTIPLLTTATGKKMGKSEDGAIWLDAERTSPYDFYQYWINVSDEDVGRFLRIYTFLPLEEIAELANRKGPDIREAKARLAWEATAITHGNEEADKAAAAARSLFTGGKDSEHVPSVEIPAAELKAGITAKDLFVRAGLAESGSDAVRVINNGGAYIEDDRIMSGDTVITDEQCGEQGFTLRRGKKQYRRVLSTGSA